MVIMLLVGVGLATSAVWFRLVNLNWRFTKMELRVNRICKIVWANNYILIQADDSGQKLFLLNSTVNL
jgi:hypothetical protein